MSLLVVSNLVIDIGAARPVDGISFSIEAGECFALLGESGCGKSMTALGLMRLLPPGARVSQGQIQFADTQLLVLPENRMRQVRGGGIGMIFQEPATSLNPVMRIGHQIGEALALHEQLQGMAARARAIELLTQVGIPDPVRRLNEFPFQLSGGMKQRVMIAMALAGRPRLLIADEPTTALDVTIQAQVLDVLDALRREQGMAVLLISHDLGVVARMADRVGVMYAGQLVEEAPRAQFFAHPAHPYSVRLFAALPDPTRRGGQLATIPGSVPPADTRYTGCRFVDRCTEALLQCRESAPEWRVVHADQKMRCVLERSSHTEKHNTKKVGAGDTVTGANQGTIVPPSLLSLPPLLTVNDLRVHFPIRRGVLRRTIGHVRAVDGISLQLQPGRTLALVGESGCGKTTAGKAILQLVSPTAGQVHLKGRSLRGLSASELRPLRAQMQMIFQDPFASLNPRMRVGDIITEGIRALGLTAGLPTGMQENAAQRVNELLVRVGLAAEMASRYPHEFSGGQRQRIAIARALAVNPSLLVCDEPTSALDVSVQAQILNLLAQLQREHQLAFLFITHNIAVVDYLAHEVAVMYLGRIVERGTTDEVLRHPQHPYTQALLAAVLPVHGPVAAMTRLTGEMPSAARPPGGCHFHPRCPHADAVCRTTDPAEVMLSATHGARCLKITG
ncbi:ABC transporter ATP-binding protein [Rugosibacter aromaticivorans]|uniref:ABC transporter ATP-binding protein n=1 Tax=Rugosibacter aromaticivorans TaxID=1565605 RepID=A0A0C5J9E2_9PROT|nr:ABC transporter ATP-binding protein [Rugosibacter aromaticivorans]AJP48304.1 ABC transporter ATP-binding protein [Rugosibacter aromaticivorans]TBR15128.1 MAG: ABC transporter ATP-binding protein [Rugosibacter sp.]